MASTWNPFSSDHLLNHVFEVCPVATLKQVRLVSKQWNAVSMKAWRQEAVLNIGSDSNDRSCVTLARLEQILDAENDTFKLVCHPFKRYVLDAGALELSSPTLDRLWQTMKYLFVDRVHFADISRQLLRKASQLRHLVLWRVNMMENQGDANAACKKKDEEELFVHANLTTFELVACGTWPPHFWSPFLRVATNISSIYLCLPTSNLRECSMDFLGTISAIRRETSHNVLNLKAFRVEGEGINRLRMLVFESGLKPSFLSLDGVLAKATPDSLLLSQSAHVIELEDYRYHPFWQNFNEPDEQEEEDDSSITSMSLPKIVLPQLSTYTSRAGIYSAMYALLEFTAEALTKVVVTMEFCPIVTVNHEDFGRMRLDYPPERRLTSHYSFTQILRAQAFPGLTVFEYTNGSNILEEEIFEQLSECMPNVKRLKMSLSKSSIGAVFKCWPDLEIFEITCTSSPCNVWDDDAFVGGGIPGVIPANSPAASRRTVRNLTKLQQFIFNASHISFPADTELTDLAATEGFLRLPALTTLHFPFTLLSAECHAALKAHVRILKVSF